MFFSKKNFHMYVCMFMMFMGIGFGMSSSSWLVIWLGMEISLMSFIPHMVVNNKLSSGYSPAKYFIFQVFGSSLFLLGTLDKISFEFVILGLMIKLGFFPAQFWVLSVSKSLDWKNFFLLMTVQKFIPMNFLMDIFGEKMNFSLTFLIMNSVVGSIGSLNQKDLRLLMVYSSMNHMTWMIFSGMLGSYFFTIYLMGYIFLLFLLTMVMYNSNIYFFHQMFYMNDLTFIVKLMLICFLFISFLGFPPFMGFFLKFISVYSSVNFFFFYILFLLLMNLFISFSYIRVFYFLFMYNSRSIIKQKSKITFPFFFIMLLIFIVL